MSLVEKLTQSTSLRVIFYLGHVTGLHVDCVINLLSKRQNNCTSGNNPYVIPTLDDTQPDKKALFAHLFCASFIVVNGKYSS